MHKLFVGLLALGLVAGAPLAHAAATEKVGVVDPNQILGQSTAGHEVQAKIKAYAAKEQKWADEQKSHLQKEHDDLQKNASVVTAAAHKKAEQQFQQDVQNYQQEAQKRQQDFQQMRQSYLTPLEGELAKVIKAYAINHGYDLIIDQGAAIYNADDLDLSAAILKAFNAAQPHAPAPDTNLGAASQN